MRGRERGVAWFSRTIDEILVINSVPNYNYISESNNRKGSNKSHVPGFPQTSRTTFPPGQDDVLLQRKKFDINDLNIYQLEMFNKVGTSIEDNIKRTQSHSPDWNEKKIASNSLRNSGDVIVKLLPCGARGPGFDFRDFMLCPASKSQFG